MTETIEATGTDNNKGLPIESWSPYIYGIDLGTTNSAIAVYKDGEARIIPIEGKMTCPSVVHFRENGDIFVGDQARRRMVIDPENTVASIKREMGTDWEKEFAGFTGRKYTPQDISTEILTKLVNSAQEDPPFDLQGTPHKVVICIPANFTQKQKEATEVAAKLANLELIGLLDEPVAAAIAHAVYKDRDQTVLVYDLGGGTFDVSILKVETRSGGSAKFKVLAKEGVPLLGGDDFDRKIMEIAAAKIKADGGPDVMDLKKDQGLSTKILREAQQKLKDIAERAKIELAEATTAQMEMPNVVKDETGTAFHLDMAITRDEFNDAIRELVLQSKEAVERALESAKLTIDDISRIILVGGSTRVPLVKEMVTEMFGKEPYSDDDPATIVTRGAALYGGRLNDPTDGDTFDDIVTHNLGIEVTGGKFDSIIEKSTEIPDGETVVRTKKYFTNHDNQTEITIRIWQSDRETTFVGSEGCTFQGEFFLKGIPPKPKGQEWAIVTFEIDRGNLLKVTGTSSVGTELVEIHR